MIRIAAVGDVHVGLDERDRIARALAPVPDQADVLLLAGDLTRCGTPDGDARSKSFSPLRSITF